MTTLNITTFRGLYPAYANETAYPDDTLNAWYGTGKCYIADNDCTLSEDCREKALMMMLAHLLFIQSLISTGTTHMQIASATQSDVSVSLVQPPSTDSFSYWLNTSPYGMQVLAMLEHAFAGGFYVGGCIPRPLISGGF